MMHHVKMNGEAHTNWRLTQASFFRNKYHVSIGQSKVIASLKVAIYEHCKRFAVSILTQLVQICGCHDYHF